MQGEALFEGIIKRLLGIQVHVNTQNRTPEKTPEMLNPERRIVYDISFPGNEETIGASWERHLEKEGREFLEAWSLIFHFCEWYRQT